VNVGTVLSSSVVAEFYVRWFDLKIITVQKYCSANETHYCTREREGKELTLMVQDVQIGQKLTLRVQSMQTGDKWTLVMCILDRS